jgi:hypothetical protein
MGGSSGAAMTSLILYRTSNSKRRNSLAFLANAGQQTALLAQLEKQSWIDEIFSRALPIPPQYPTRFGPPGFSKNVFYASERRETTFFEYGYHLLKAESIQARGIAAICYEIQFQGKRKPIDASFAKNQKAILSPKTYAAAHEWISGQSPVPESVRYPSVREPAEGGINFAIYEPSAVIATRAEIEELILTPQSNGSVDVESLNRGALSSIRPVR